jgi:hypothetical protein
VTVGLGRIETISFLSKISARNCLNFLNMCPSCLGLSRAGQIMEGWVRIGSCYSNMSFRVRQGGQGGKCLVTALNVQS